MDCRWFAHCRITQNSIDHLHIKYSTNTTNTIHIYIFVILYHRYWRALKPKTCTQLWDVFWIVFARSRVSTNYKIKFSLQHLKFENLNNHLKQKKYVDWEYGITTLTLPVNFVVLKTKQKVLFNQYLRKNYYIYLAPPFHNVTTSSTQPLIRIKNSKTDPLRRAEQPGASHGSSLTHCFLRLHRTYTTQTTPN